MASLSADNGKAEKTLAKNTLIYMVGNAGGRLLQMLMLPVVTAVLLTSEYGYYDLVVTSIGLVGPVATLQITEAMFRHLFEGNERENSRTLSTVFLFLCFSSVILLVGVVAVALIVPAFEYPGLVFFAFVTSMFFKALQKVARSWQRNAEVAISGVVQVAVMLVVQALTLLVIGMRADGMLLALAIAYLGGTIYLECRISTRKLIRISRYDGNHLKEMVSLSLPLVPNSVCWWFVSACNKFFVSGFISVAANGIFAIASSFASLLAFVTSVFQMAWQESTIMESSSDSRQAFYSNTFNAYMKLMLCGFVVAMPAIRLLMPVLVASEYSSAYLYVPILLASAVFSAFSQFYGSSYLAFRQTGDALTSTLFAALINCLTVIALIPFIGLYAPAFGSAIAFLFQWLFRVRQTRSYFKVDVDVKALLACSLVCAASTVIYYQDNVLLQIGMLAVGLAFLLVANRYFIRLALKKVRGK